MPRFLYGLWSPYPSRSICKYDSVNMTEPIFPGTQSFGMPAPLCAIALRLTPQQDLRLELDA